MATYVGKWDCPACGTKRIPGWKNGRTVERCLACGSPCTKKWYLDDRNMVIGNPEEVKKATSKRAWTCGHCSHVNDGEDTSCDGCGNPRSAESGDSEVILKEYSLEETPTEESQVIEQKDTRYGKSPRQPVPVSRKLKKTSKKRNLGWIAPTVTTFAGVCYLVIGLFVTLFFNKKVPVSASGFRWERKMSIEHFGPVSYNSWDYPPSGAYNITQQEEIHHYDKIYEGQECHTESRSYVCGTVDNGNGTFSDKYCDENVTVCEDKYREEPVYETKYYYDIDEWSHHHWISAKGFSKQTWYPKDSLTETRPTLWREGSIEGVYFLTVKEASGSTHEEEIDWEQWEPLQQGDSLVGLRNRIWGIWMGLAD